ncbi:MAG: hypothetical protein P4M00_21720 [Azospirillaceae bacterium]|nr:hypothetical protein [Azospirillaceae bacterium]
MADDSKFADLGRPRRVWAIGAIHGHVDRLAALHDDIGRRFRVGDRVLYLGNFLGHGPGILATLDELLLFRREIMAVRSVIASDIVYLRGAQEEMWQKLLQLQFAPNPQDVLTWMLGQGIEATLAAYGGDARQGLAAARDGAVTLTRWTNMLRQAIRSHGGHDNLMSGLRRCAYNSDSDGQSGPLLFVSSGVEPTRPLAAQGDTFWWGSGFLRITEPYDSFSRVVRGYDPAHAGIRVTDYTLTLDGGCGFGGTLAAACLAPDGEIIEIVEA